MKPIRRVPMIPNTHPELANASGTANNPDPSEALIKLAVERTSLKGKGYLTSKRVK